MDRRQAHARRSKGALATVSRARAGSEATVIAVLAALVAAGVVGYLVLRPAPQKARPATRTSADAPATAGTPEAGPESPDLGAGGGEAEAPRADAAPTSAAVEATSPRDEPRVPAEAGGRDANLIRNGSFDRTDADGKPAEWRLVSADRVIVVKVGERAGSSSRTPASSSR